MNILIKIIQRWMKVDTLESSEQGGLLLARIPEEIALQIDAYYKKQNEAKEEAVDNDLLKEQHPSMKFQKESNTRVTFGGTKKS